MKGTLDLIFSQSRALENIDALQAAGFTIIAGPMPFSYVIVARHPAVTGYVFKLYLDSEMRQRKQIPHWVWLVRRCSGARLLKELIQRKGLHLFAVPDKWLYLLPEYPASSGSNPQLVVLMETDMQPESCEITEKMWKQAVTREHLEELYVILKQGYGGHGLVSLTANIPFTKQGIFAITDTEDPQADLKLPYIKRFLSPEMQEYWDTLTN